MHHLDFEINRVQMFLFVDFIIVIKSMFRYGTIKTVIVYTTIALQNNNSLKAMRYTPNEKTHFELSVLFMIWSVKIKHLPHSHVYVFVCCA